jgi:hypothetical protein
MCGSASFDRGAIKKKQEITAAAQKKFHKQSEEMRCSMDA